MRASTKRMSGKRVALLAAAIVTVMGHTAPADAASATTHQGSGAAWTSSYPGGYFGVYASTTGETPIDGTGRWYFQGVVKDEYPCQNNFVWVSGFSHSTGEDMVASYSVRPDNSGVSGTIEGYANSDCWGREPFVVSFNVDTNGPDRTEHDLRGTQNWLRIYRDGGSATGYFQWAPGQGSYQTTTSFGTTRDVISETYHSSFVP